jgi:hypothetical protein
MWQYAICIILILIILYYFGFSNTLIVVTGAVLSVGLVAACSQGLVKCGGDWAYENGKCEEKQGAAFKTREECETFKLSSDREVAKNQLLQQITVVNNIIQEISNLSTKEPNEIKKTIMTKVEKIAKKYLGNLEQISQLAALDTKQIESANNIIKSITSLKEIMTQIKNNPLLSSAQLEAIFKQLLPNFDEYKQQIFDKSSEVQAKLAQPGCIIL